MAAEALDIDYGAAQLLTGKGACFRGRALLRRTLLRHAQSPPPLAAENVQALRQHPPAQDGRETFDVRLRQAPVILADSERARHQG